MGVPGVFEVLPFAFVVRDTADLDRFELMLGGMTYEEKLKYFPDKPREPRKKPALAACPGSIVVAGNVGASNGGGGCTSASRGLVGQGTGTGTSSGGQGGTMIKKGAVGSGGGDSASALLKSEGASSGGEKAVGVPEESSAENGAERVPELGQGEQNSAAVGGGTATSADGGGGGVVVGTATEGGDGNDPIRPRAGDALTVEVDDVDAVPTALATPQGAVARGAVAPSPPESSSSSSSSASAAGRGENRRKKTKAHSVWLLKPGRNSKNRSLSWCDSTSAALITGMSERMRTT